MRKFSFMKHHWQKRYQGDLFFPALATSFRTATTPTRRAPTARNTSFASRSGLERRSTDAEDRVAGISSE